MRPTTSPDRPAQLRALEQVLAHAYESARGTGYRPGSQEMDALASAENRYQQAKGQ